MKAVAAQAAETALKTFSDFLKNKFTQVEPWTDYFVCNVYSHENVCVGQHSDADSHWGAVDGESVILSYTYEQAGIMLVYPSVSGEYQKDKTLLDYCWASKDITKAKSREAQLVENNVIEAILLRPNSLLVMGGFFQGQLVHETIPDKVIRSIGFWWSNPDRQGSTPPLEEADMSFWKNLSNCPGWETTIHDDMSMQVSPFRERTVFTLRHVACHDNLCAQNNNPLPALIHDDLSLIHI